MNKHLSPEHLSSQRFSPSVPGLSTRAEKTADEAGVELLLLDFRSGEAVNRHPELRNHLEQGATIKSAEPRITETGALKLLVVLARPEAPSQT